VCGLLLTRRLHRGYISALESNLIGRADQIGTPEEDDLTRTTFLQTIAQLDLSGQVPTLDADSSSTAIAAHDRETREIRRPAGVAAPAAAPAPAPADPLLATAAHLRSGDPVRARRALRDASPLPPELVPIVIPLLAWDDVASWALQALRGVVDRHSGQLVDALLDPDEDFSIRRRLPRVLSAAATDRAAEGLIRALSDRRFEVRYQSGVALAKLRDRISGLPVDRGAIFEAVAREAKVDRGVWESQRLFDDTDADAEAAPFFDEAIRTRTSRSLEHVFTLLSLVLPRRPLQIAYRGLYASDESLRGTALEYLEVILPPEIREGLWPFLEDRRPAPSGSKSRQEILDSLLRSHHSIEIDLSEIRRRTGEG